MEVVGCVVGVVGLVEGVVVRPGLGVVVPGVVPGDVPVLGGAGAPAFVCPITAAGINKPKAIGPAIALTQIFEAILTSVNCQHYPTKIEFPMLTAHRLPWPDAHC
jgi:hypothetical protein